MFSLKTSVFFFCCIAVAVAYPQQLFKIRPRPGNTGRVPEYTGREPGNTGYPGRVPVYTGGVPVYTGRVPGYTGGVPGYHGRVPGYPGTVPGYPGRVPVYTGRVGYSGPVRPYRNEDAPFNQQAGQSSVFSDVDVDAGADSTSNSAEVGGSPLGGDGADDAADAELDRSDVDTPDSPDTGVAGVADGAQQGGGNNAGDTSSTPSPNVLGGGPGLIVDSGKGSSTGVGIGVTLTVLTVVGLAAGGAFYAYRKRQAASYGSRF